MIGYEEGTNAAGSSVATTDSVPILSSRYHRPVYQFLKRVFDIVFSIVALLILSPIFCAIAIVIAVTDGPPMVFRQSRLGMRGKLFHIYKFRTMVKNAEAILRSRPDLWKEYQETYKIKNDPRISRLGKFLRNTSLDELPQLFNVLKGEMSIVGPRPIVQAEISKFGDQADIYLSMKPGCAGLWACSGRSDTTYEERVRLEREYFDKASLWFDMRIIFKTLVAVLLRRGAT
jgi:lipopolysaccharide/colanic/teichoic acid biosynthesis glycosyltransferase